MEELLIPAHGGYRKLKSFQTTTIIYDLTVDFCGRFVKDYRMKDQMVQAARSGRQNLPPTPRFVLFTKPTFSLIVS